MPIVVAINKIDRENADPDRVMHQLAEHGLAARGSGAATPSWSEVSALAGHRHRRPAREPAGRRRARGPPGQPRRPRRRRRARVEPRHRSWPGGHRARAARHAAGRRPAGGRRRLGSRPGPHQRPGQAGQGSRPVDARRRCSACPTSPTPATASWSPPTRRPPRKVAATREHWQREASLGRDAHAMSGGARLEDIFEQIQAGEAATLNLIVKADVTGSLEALTESLRKLERDEVKLAFVHRGVGGITQDDIQLAATSNATIIGFNVRPDRKARELADSERRRDPDLRDHLPGARGHRERHARPARARVRRGGHRRGRGPRDLPGAAGRRHRRLLRASTAPSPAAPRCASSARARSSGRARSSRCARFKDDVREVAGRLRVRHRPVRLPGPQAGRHHRDLRGSRRSRGPRPSVRCRGRARARARRSTCAIPTPHSLKEKRAVVTPDPRRAPGIASSVAAAETGRQDRYQRAELSFAVVSGSASHTAEVIDAVERFVWSFPEIEVVDAERALAGGRRDERATRGRRPATTPGSTRARPGSTSCCSEIVADALEQHRRRAPRAGHRHHRRGRPRPAPRRRLLRLARRARPATPRCSRRSARSGARLQARHRARRPASSARPSWPSGPTPRCAAAPASRRSWPRSAAAPPTHGRPDRDDDPTADGEPPRPTARTASVAGADAVRDGLAVVDKEAGWTSHDVVAKARGILAHRRSATRAPSTPTPPACCCSASVG